MKMISNYAFSSVLSLNYTKYLVVVPLQDQEKKDHECREA